MCIVSEEGSNIASASAADFDTGFYCIGRAQSDKVFCRYPGLEPYKDFKVTIELHSEAIWKTEQLLK